MNRNESELDSNKLGPDLRDYFAAARFQLSENFTSAQSEPLSVACAQCDQIGRYFGLWATF